MELWKLVGILSSHVQPQQWHIDKGGGISLNIPIQHPALPHEKHRMHLEYGMTQRCGKSYKKRESKKVYLFCTKQQLFDCAGETNTYNVTFEPILYLLSQFSHPVSLILFVYETLMILPYLTIVLPFWNVQTSFWEHAQLIHCVLFVYWYLTMRALTHESLYPINVSWSLKMLLYLNSVLFVIETATLIPPRHSVQPETNQFLWLNHRSHLLLL